MTSHSFELLTVSTDPTVPPVPVIRERIVDDRHGGQPTQFGNWILGTNLAFAVYLSLASLHLIKNPLPVAGGRGELVPLWGWAAALVIAVWLKLWGRRNRDMCWRARGAKWGFTVWLFLTVAVYLPGVPVMMWCFGPAMVVAEAMVYLRLSTISVDG